MTENYQNIKKYLLKYDVFIHSFFLNILCVFFFRLICEVHFDTDTDQFLNHILSGVYGENLSAYGWLHIITGYSLKTLYSVIPQIPWYALMQYFSVFISLLLLTYVIFKINSHWGGFTANILILILLGYECYARISYIKTGVLCLSVAGFIFFQMVCERIRGRIYLILGMLLFFAGYLWWDKSLLPGLLLLLPCVYCLYKRKNLNSFKDYRPYIFSGLSLFLCLALLGAGNEFYLKERDSEIAKSVEYTRAWEDINNFGWPDFNTYYPQYEALGISENKYSLLSNNEFVESYIVEPDVLVKIKEFVDTPEFTISDFLQFTRTYPIRYFETGLFVGFLAVLILFFLSKACKKARKTVYLFCGTGIIYYICYLAGVDDNAVIRTSIWLAAIISALGFSHDIEVKDLELRPYYSAVVTVAMVILTNQELNAITQVINKDFISTTTKWMELVASDSSKSYVTNSTDFYQKDKPFHVLEKSSLDNILVTKFPYTLYNPKVFSTVLDEPDNVRFLSESCVLRTVDYMNEQYGYSYYPVQVKSIDNIAIYAIRADEPFVNTDTVKKAGSDIVSDLHLSIMDSGKKAVKGNIYKKNTNSFSQMVYVEVYDCEENSYKYYDVNQTESSVSSDVMNGKYATIYTEIEPVKNGEYAVILEVDGDMYRVPLLEKGAAEGV